MEASQEEVEDEDFGSNNVDMLEEENVPENSTNNQGNHQMDPLKSE